LTYGALGGVFGAVGHAFTLAGLGRWVCITAGVVILIGLLIPSRVALDLPIGRSVAWLKSGFGSLLRRRGIASLLALGLLNGFLPCGLVYVGCAAAATAGGPLAGIEYMLAFGFGTLPMMLTLALAGPKLRLALRFNPRVAVPACVALVGVLLVLRGLSLGVPYLSPDLSSPAACH
jgi:hypothetical protein